MVQFEDEDRFDSMLVGWFAVGRDRTTTVGFFDERIGNDGHVF